MYILVCKRCGCNAKQMNGQLRNTIICSNPKCECQQGEWVDED